MKDGIYSPLDKDVIGNIMVDETEAADPGQMGYVIRRSRDQVIQAENFMPFGDESVAKMASDEPRPSGD